MLQISSCPHLLCHQPASCCWTVPNRSILVCIPGATSSRTRSSSRRQHIRRHFAVVRFLFLQGGIGISLGSETVPGIFVILPQLQLDADLNIRHSNNRTKLFHPNLRIATSFRCYRNLDIHSSQSHSGHGVIPIWSIYRWTAQTIALMNLPG